MPKIIPAEVSATKNYQLFWERFFCTIEVSVCPKLKNICSSSWLLRTFPVFPSLYWFSLQVLNSIFNFCTKYGSEQLNQHDNHIFAGVILSSRLTSPTPCKKEKQYPSRIFNKQSIWNLLAWFPHQRPDFSHHLWSWKMEMSSLQPLHTSHSTAPGCPRRTKWKFGCYWGLLRQNCGAEA